MSDEMHQPRDVHDAHDHAADDDHGVDVDVSRAGGLERGRQILILDTSIHLLYPSILVLGLYIMFAGHNRPGGGFVGGLVIGSGLALRYVSGGAAAVRSTFRIPPNVILGTGLLVSAATAFVPVLLGGSILEHGDADFDLPIFGHVKVTSALSFDIGVDLTVIGLVLMAFAAFGEDRSDAPDASDDGSDASHETTEAPR